MSSVIGIDFFSGCGGTSLGLKQAGIRIVRGIDFDPTCKEVYEKNIRGADFLNEDISKLNPVDVLSGIKRDKKDFLLFSACAPCQPFSARNPSKGSSGDDRKNLLLSFARFVDFHRPDFVFVENVPGIQNVKGNSGIFSKFLKKLKSYGYQFAFDVVDAKDYGVPQSRKRLILLASNLPNIELSLPSFTHGPGKRPYVTVKEAIADFPLIKQGEEHSLNGHRARGLSDINLKRIKTTPKNGGSRLSWPKHLSLDCHKSTKGHSDVYGRMSWSKPAPTLTCKCTSISNGRYGHPTQDRAITPREAASLQTFPKSFKLFGGIDQMTRHVGNAVPPLLAKNVGKKILRILDT